MDRSIPKPPPNSEAPGTELPASGPGGWGPRSTLAAIRTRLMSGIILTLPIVITFWIVYWIVLTLEQFLLNPIAGVLHRIHAWITDNPALQEFDLPNWWYNVASPVLALFLMVAFLYAMGLIVRTWLYRTLDWFLLRVPIVATIYRAVRNVVDSLGSSSEAGRTSSESFWSSFPTPGFGRWGWSPMRCKTKPRGGPS